MTHDERERFYIAATTLQRLRIANTALSECLPGSEAFPGTDLNIDVRGALGHLSVAIGEMEEEVSKFMDAPEADEVSAEGYMRAQNDEAPPQ